MTSMIARLRWSRALTQLFLIFVARRMNRIVWPSSLAAPSSRCTVDLGLHVAYRPVLVGILHVLDLDLHVGLLYYTRVSHSSSST